MKAAIDALLALVLLIAVPLAANADVMTSAEDVAEVTTKIGFAQAQFALAAERQDWEMISNLYTDDAVLLPPSHGFIRGKKSINEFWKSELVETVKGVTLKQVSIDLLGDTAIETGTIETQGVASANYVAIWKRQANGAWQMDRHVWNAARPAE